MGHSNENSMEPGEVDALAVHRQPARQAGERAVEALLDDLGHEVRRAAVEETLPLVPAQNLPSWTPKTLF